MQHPTYRSVETIRLEAELVLADYLFENDIISESQYGGEFIPSGRLALMEAARTDSPGYFYNNIHYIEFRNAWNNIEEYPTAEAVWLALHPGQTPTGRTAQSFISRALKKFLGKGSDPGVPGAVQELIAHDTMERNKKERELRSIEASEIGDSMEPRLSVDPGSRRKASRSGNIERASELFSGELYSDMSRIPKRRWGSWWKRWVRKATSVADPEAGILSLRNWTKHFIMGYQIERDVYFEIWYNSMDSSFSVHDKYGNVVNRGDHIPRIRDALNLLFHNTAKFSPLDQQVISKAPVEFRAVNDDISRALQGEMPKVVSDADRMTANKERLTAAREATQERERKEAERRSQAAVKARGKAERDAGKEDDAAFKKDSKAREGAGVAYKKSMDSARQFGQWYRGWVDSKWKEHDEMQRKASEFRSDGGQPAPKQEELTKRQREARNKLNAIVDELDKANAELQRNPDSPEVVQKAKDIKAKAKQFGEDLDKLKKTGKSIKPVKKTPRDKANKTAKVRDEPSLSDYAPELDTTIKKDDKEKPKKMAPVVKRRRSVNESISDLNPELADRNSEEPEDQQAFDPSDYEQNPLYFQEVNRDVEQIRKQAESSPFTRQVVSAMFMDGFIQSYDATRVRDRRSMVRRMFERLRLFRGRWEPIALPSRVASTAMRVKGFLSGAQARADFVIGYTINDVANFEIWYIQEIAPDGKNQYASFYLYDVTAMKVLERNLPHYRNAVQLLVLKIGSDSPGKGA